MFSNPIIAYTTPFFAESEEKMIINPNVIIGLGIDNHNNIFINLVDGGRYYIADNCEKTALEICQYMYNTFKGFNNEKLPDIISGIRNGKE